MSDLPTKILVAGTTLHFWADEDEMVGWLTDAFPGRIVYRPHPRRTGGFRPERAPLDELTRQLREAAVVIAAFSTVLIEAALLGIPSCVVSFGRSFGDPADLSVHTEYEHMAEVLAWPGVYVCRSYPALVDRIQYVLDGRVPEYVRKTLATCALEVARADGHAQERILQAIETWTPKP